MNASSKTIVCYGDSNTHGYNSSNMGRFTEKERFPCLLAELLGPGWLVREEGLSGRTTSFDDPLFEGLNGFSMLHPCLMTHEPVDLLIVMLGTNDVKERFAATPENIAKGLERLVTKALVTKEAWRDTPAPSRASACTLMITCTCLWKVIVCSPKSSPPSSRTSARRRYICAGLRVSLPRPPRQPAYPPVPERPAVCARFRASGSR